MPSDVSKTMVERLREELCPGHNTVTVTAHIPSRRAMGRLLASVRKACDPGATGSGGKIADETKGFVHLGCGTRMVWWLADGSVQEAGEERAFRSMHTEDGVARPLLGPACSVFARYTHDQERCVPAHFQTAEVPGFHTVGLPRVQVLLTRRRQVAASSTEGTTEGDAADGNTDDAGQVSGREA